MTRSSKRGRDKDYIMWPSYRVTNYATLIHPYAFVSLLLGLLPCKIESSKIVQSKFRFAISTFQLIVYIVLIVLGFIQINITSTGLPLSQLIHSNFIMLLGSTIFIAAFFASPSTVKAIQSVSNVSRLLQPGTFYKLAKIMYITSALIFLPLLVHILILLLKTNILFFYTCWLTFFVGFALTNLYMNNVLVLKACFKYINDSLTKVTDILINDEPHLLRRVYHTRNNHVLLAKLRNLKRQHLEISEVVDHINDSFGTQNMGIIALLFMDVTFNLYECVAHNTLSGGLGGWSILAFVYAINYSAHVSMLVWATETTGDQVKKIGMNIHRILIHTLDERMTFEVRSKSSIEF